MATVERNYISDIQFEAEVGLGPEHKTFKNSPAHTQYHNTLLFEGEKSRFVTVWPLSARNPRILLGRGLGFLCPRSRVSPSQVLLSRIKAVIEM